MDKDHFVSKIQHLMSRFGYPSSTQDRDSAGQEQRDWCQELWQHVRGWDEGHYAGFSRAIDALVSDHKGGRPTVALILSKSRQEMGGRPRETDSRGNVVDRDDPDWGKFGAPTVKRAREDQDFMSESAASGLWGYGMKDYIDWRRRGAEPQAARDQADQNRNQLSRQSTETKADAIAKLQAFQKVLRGGPSEDPSEDQEGWENG